MKKAIITGASRGIGRAIALSISDLGYDFFLTGRDLDALKETKDEILRSYVSADGRTPEIVLCTEDLAEPDAAERIFSCFSSSFDRLDLLVNNAGIVNSKPVRDYSPEDWTEIMTINAGTPFFLMQSCLPLLEQADPGFVVNICSVVAKKGYANQALYSASKHALLGWSKAAARELNDKNIRIHAILPGGVDTELVRSVRPDIDASEMISPEDVAESVRFLLQMKGNAVIDEISIRRKSKTPWE